MNINAKILNKTLAKRIDQLKEKKKHFDHTGLFSEIQRRYQMGKKKSIQYIQQTKGF